MRTDSTLPELVDISGAAELLGVSRQAVHKMVERGDLPGRQLNGRTWAFARDRVQALADGPLPWSTFLPSWLTAPEVPPSRHYADRYGETGGDEHTAARNWNDVLCLAGGSPPLALVLGAAISSILLPHITQAPYWVHLTGPVATGKTIALDVASALYGPPSGLTNAGPSTAEALRRGASSRGCLPSFVDEFAPSDEDVAALFGSFRFQSVNNAEGLARRIMSRPAGVVMTAGIERKRSHDTVVARGPVVQINAPLWTQADGHAICQDASAESYGWPLAWLRTADVDDVPHFDHAATVAEILGEPRRDGVTRVGNDRHVESLASAAMGAAMLEVAVPNAACELYGAALMGARAVLNDEYGRPVRR